MAKMERPAPLVALLTDFGTDDHYVGVMKASMLEYNIDTRFLDLSHGVRPGSIISAAYLLFAAWEWLPPSCLVLAVVDPGVGSQRRELVVEYDDRYIVCPDNGLVTLLATRVGKVQQSRPAPRYFRLRDEVLTSFAELTPEYAHTFHGRDLFAPAAARLLSDRTILVPLDETPVLLPELAYSPPSAGPNAAAELIIVHVDHFGTLVTSLYVEDRLSSSADGPEAGDLLVPGSTVVAEIDGTSRELPIAETFSDVLRGEMLAYWGSSGFLEIAVRDGRADEMFRIASQSEGEGRSIGPGSRCAFQVISA